jgi:hypothetical protein
MRRSSPAGAACNDFMSRETKMAAPAGASAWSKLYGYVPARRPARAAREMPGCHLATFTSKVTLFAPGPRLRTSNLNFPSFFGVNFTSHFGPGLVSLPTSFLFAS